MALLSDLANRTSSKESKRRYLRVLIEEEPRTYRSVFLGLGTLAIRIYDTPMKI